VYEGDFLGYKKHGRGTYTWSNGTKYIGSYVDDNCHGQGVNVFASGERYEGTFAKGKWHGQGINTLADGQRLNPFLENTFLSKLKSFLYFKIRGDFCQQHESHGKVS
jgi:hypothetical protein